jgi:hypothetical protein
VTEWLPGPKRPEDEPVPKAPEPVRPDPMDLPPDVPRSPSGRVPQWVLDEAAGRPSEPVPFRAWQSDAFSAPSPKARRRSRIRATVAVVALAGLVSGIVWWGQQGAAPPSYADPPREAPAPTAPAPSASTPASNGGPRTTAPAPGLGETPRPASLPEGDLQQPKSKGYAFVSKQADKKTGVTWSPCRPVRWVLRAEGQAPRDGDRMLREAFARLAEETGLDFEYLGTTTEKYADKRKAYQPSRYGKNWAPVLVSWSSLKDDPALAGDVLGRAGPLWVVSDSGDRTFISGTVSLDAAELGRLRSGYAYEVARAVVMHELAHLAGLSHVKSTTSLMNARVQRGVTDFSAADLAGLKALGQGPCQPDA